MGLFRVWEVARFGFLQSMSLAQQDMDKYALYFLLTDAVGCDQLFQSFALFFLINTFIQFPIQFFNGWLIDFTEDYQNLTMLVSSLIQTLAFSLMFLGPHNFWFLLVIWQLRQCATMLSMTSVWKLIKLRIDVTIFNNKLLKHSIFQDNKDGSLHNLSRRPSRDTSTSISSTSVTINLVFSHCSGGGGGDSNDINSSNNNNDTDPRGEEKTKLLSSPLSDAAAVSDRVSISIEDTNGCRPTLVASAGNKHYESTGPTLLRENQPQQQQQQQQQKAAKKPTTTTHQTDISLDQETAILSRVGNLGDILADTIEASCLCFIALLAKNGSKILPYLFGDWWYTHFENTAELNYLIVRWAVIGVTLFYSLLVVLLTLSISRPYISKRASARKLLHHYRSCASIETLTSISQILADEDINVPWWPKLHSSTDVISIITTPNIVDLTTAAASSGTTATGSTGTTTTTTTTTTTSTTTAAPHSDSTSAGDDYSPSLSPLLPYKVAIPESNNHDHPIQPASDNRVGMAPSTDLPRSCDVVEATVSMKDPEFFYGANHTTRNLVTSADPNENDVHQIFSPSTTITKPATATSSSGVLRRFPFATTFCHYFWSRTHYFLTNHVTFNAMLHAFLILFLYNLVEYPLTLLESGSTDVDPGVEKKPENFCAGQLSNLMMQGAILNCTFLVGSIFYGIFLVRCPPRIYFTFIFPALACILIITIGSLWFEVTSRFAVVVFIVVSLSQVLPYYLNAFDFYVFTSSTKENYYGFVSSIYGFGSQLIYMATGLIMTFPFLAQNLHVIIVACLVLLVLAIVHSFYFIARHHRLLASKVPTR